MNAHMPKLVVPYRCWSCREYFAAIRKKGDSMFLVDRETLAVASFCPFCGADQSKGTVPLEDEEYEALINEEHGPCPEGE